MTTIESSVSFEASAPHKRAQHATLTASPTLTNPDMILPEYDRSFSPLSSDESMQSSVWRAAPATHASSMQDSKYSSQPHQYNAYTTPQTTVSTGTPIIYGNGTMLSDIGEVTEAESTPGRPSPPRNRYGGAVASAVPSAGVKVEDSEGDAALRSSPTIGNSGALGGVRKRAKAAQRERRDSTDSNSTVTGHDQTSEVAVFEDFDDTVSVGDSVFQGDDEESMASSYADDDASFASGSLLSSALKKNRDSVQKYSTAQLSRRAEQILANAKKRLTHMEDNLSKARSSLLVVTNQSVSSPSSPSPPVARASTALMMSTTGQLSPGTGHYRSGSDNSLRIGIPIKVYPQRSSSVLGVSTGPRHPGLTVSRSADQLNGQFNRQRASHTVSRELEPLGEDDVSQTQRRSELFHLNRNSSFTSPTFGTPSEKGLSRSASTSHMRDIKDQVNDLKGKISSLREQARVDSLKRSSLQNLRTPSPFTHAKVNQWHTRSTDDAEQIPPIEEDVGMPLRTDDTATGDIVRDGGSGVFEDGTFEAFSSVDGEEAEDISRLEQLSPDPFEYDIGAGAEDDNEDLLTENGDSEEDGILVESDYEEAAGVDDDVTSDSGDSIYHESVQHAISHEDREDAFDYEHFFLHSAMGTLSQGLARRASDASFTSEESVETTRGPIAETEDTDQEMRPSLQRRRSDSSVSTMESFATATEGWSSRQGSLDLLSQEPDGTIDEEHDEAADILEPETFPTFQPLSEALERPETPPTAKRSTSAGVGTVSSPAGQGSTRLDNLYSSMRRPISPTAMTRPHAPSVSSFESVGTTRSFPLVNRLASKSSGSSGAFTPEGRLSGSDGRTTSNNLFSGHTSQTTCVGNGQRKHSLSGHSTSSTTSLIEENGTTAVMETLPQDEQILVGRLVASLGQCVLGLTENSRASTEARMYRRRIDAARRILEGLEKV